MALSYRDIRNYGSARVGSALVARAAVASGCRVVSDDSMHLELRARVSWASFGERITVNLATVNEECVVDIESRCCWSLTLVDWGKNERNVLRLFEAIEQEADKTLQWRRVPMCDACGYPLVGLRCETCPECSAPIPDGPRRREPLVRGLRRAVIAAFLLTSIEYLIFCGLRLLGLHGALVVLFQGPLHLPIWLLLFNGVLNIGLMLVSHWVSDRRPSSYRGQG